MRCILLFLFSILSFSSGFAQVKKQMVAVRVNVAPRIDGVLDELEWQEAQPAKDFVQNQLKPGDPCTQPTEVRILYDDNALYIGAILYDRRDSVLKELGKRDTEANTDLFGVVLDTYRDGINAFGFYLTPAGVQLDARYSTNGRDLEWNAVWDSKVTINEDAWVVEFMIPFSAIRFSNADIQHWGINFTRKIRRHREVSYWNHVDPAVAGFINQSGELLGIRNIKSPIRLSVTPYVSAYADHFKKANGQTATTSTFNAGADIKYGINESFTLDMTLVPDFGQVQSDNLVLNLSPFEVQFNDFRPFFTEGTELFNRGGLFYSRRVGGTPMNYYKMESTLKDGERLVNNPSASQLMNASKISGRTGSGLGIGVFNATTASTFATIEDSRGERRQVMTDPLTNYSVLVFDQSLKNNSFISLVNTNVLREGSFYDANVTGMQFRLNNKKITHAISGHGTLTQKLFPEKDNSTNGHAYMIDFSKISGNFQYYLNHSVRSNLYDPRDMGFMFTNNEINFNPGLKYSIFKPFWKVNNLHTRLGLWYSNRYDPNTFQNLTIYGSANTTFSKHFFSTGMGFGIEPIVTYDFFEPRSYGRFYAFPTNQRVNYWFSSDYRKKFALDGNVSYRTFNENNRSSFFFSLSPRFRASNKLFFVFSNENSFNRDDVGFVDNLENQVIFGVRNLKTLTNTLTNTYTFTNRMSLSLRIRHYWSEAIYSKYQLLEENGFLGDVIYNRTHDVNFNAFNVDMVYIWNFAPGSEMSIVWKNSILQKDRDIYLTYFSNLRNTLDSPQINSISIKILYFIDYLNVRKAFR
jgi:hypothetical protein